MVERSETIMVREDEEVAELMQSRFVEEGIEDGWFLGN